MAVPFLATPNQPAAPMSAEAFKTKRSQDFSFGAHHILLRGGLLCMRITSQHQSGTFNPEALGLVMEERIDRGKLP